MAVAKEPEPTPARLLGAAAELFAARGFHGTTVRDIAERAGANVASSNYHFGSKDGLYLGVLRTQFAQIRAALERRAAMPSPRGLSTMTRPQLIGILKTRIQIMLEILLGPPPGLHGTLMQREMCDPSEALPVIVAEFIRPQVEEMRRLLGSLFPQLTPIEIDRCAFSTVGQVLFYRFMRPALLDLMQRSDYPRGFARQMTDHIAEFSLGGMERIAARHRRRRARHGA
jgi:AcrR family transcriptional regulator